LKSGDRIIWLYSKKRSFVTGWRLQRIPGVIERICRARIRIRVRLGEEEKVVSVAAENLVCDDETRYLVQQPQFVVFGVMSVWNPRYGLTKDRDGRQAAR
jgi:hypothetical protein